MALPRDYRVPRAAGNYSSSSLPLPLIPVSDGEAENPRSTLVAEGIYRLSRGGVSASATAAARGHR